MDVISEFFRYYLGSVASFILYILPDSKFLISSLSKQSYLLFLIGILVSAGIIKENELLRDLIMFACRSIKNKKILLSTISLLSGCLPVPGRVSVSAGALSLIAPDPTNEANRKSFSKFGVIDYLSTHHYYLWSPLEKTVFLPMAVLQISWLTFMGYTLPLLLISFAYVVSYISMKVDERDLIIKDDTGARYDLLRAVKGFVPIIAALVLLALFEKCDWLIFSALALYYMAITRTGFARAFGYIKWNLVAYLALVIFIGSIADAYHGQIYKAINEYSFLSMRTVSGFLLISSVAFLSSLLLGSSGKFAAIMSTLCWFYGIEYLVWFFALEFAGYNFSPAHKCVVIGMQWFDTPLETYFGAIASWMFFVVAYAVIYTGFMVL